MSVGLTGRAVLLLILAFTVPACSPMYFAARPPVDISGYRGEGTIVRLKHPINPGFEIDFEPFSLAAPHTAAYRLDGLPRPRHSSPYEVGLAVELDPDEVEHWPEVPSWLKAGSLGKLAFRVKTQAGQNLLAIEGPVAGQYWIRRLDDNWLFAVLRVPSGSGHATSRFPSESVHDLDQPMGVLVVDFTPGSDAPPRQAKVRIMAGGED